MPFRKRPANPFESRTEVWHQVGLGEQIDRGQAQRARGAAVLVVVLIVGVLIVFDHRRELFPGGGTVVKIGTVAALVVLGWALARTLARGIVPALYRRLDPGTAGTVGFLVRLLAIAGMLIVALRVAGLDAGTLAVGGAFTAVVLGLAAQQTLGNLFAGLVLLSTRPFRVGERVRLQGGSLGGAVDGIASSLGLFYTTLVSGADRIMVPNSVILQIAVVPLREPERVEMRARFDATTSPGDLQKRLDESVSVPLRYPPDVSLEELDGDEVVLNVAATPMNANDGAELASELIDAMRARPNGDLAKT
jgi:small conductance mechanosensitive channel